VSSETFQIYRRIGMTPDQAAAATLQQEVIAGAKEKIAEGADFSEAEVRLATVHTRQDLVLLVYYVSEMLSEARSIRRRLDLILLLAILFAVWLALRSLDVLS